MADRSWLTDMVTVNIDRYCFVHLSTVDVEISELIQSDQLPRADADVDCRIENYQHPNREQDCHDDIAMKVILVQYSVFVSVLELVRAVESFVDGHSIELLVDVVTVVAFAPVSPNIPKLSLHGHL